MGVNFALCAGHGHCGKQWYQRHVEKKLLKVAADNASEDVIRRRLARRGGTNVAAALAAWLVVALVFALVMLRMINF
jgi:hypothetical protein